MEKEAWEEIVGKVNAVESLTLVRSEEKKNERLCSLRVKETGIKNSQFPTRKIVI